MSRHLTVVKLLAIIVLASQPLFARKHWRRAPVHGAFNVDVYAYNKPVINLVEQQPKHHGQALPMGQLLEQLSREMSMQKSHYRNLDTDNYTARSQGVAAVATSADRIMARQKKSSVEELEANNLAINRQLAELQMNFTAKNKHAMRNLYSHEFHVDTKGKRKIVLLNTLSKGSASGNGAAGQDSKPASAEDMSEPLNFKLAMPALPEQLPEEQEEEADVDGEVEMEVETETTTSKVIENWSTLELPLKADFTEAISTLQQMERNEETTTTAIATATATRSKVQPNKSHDSEQQTDDIKHGPKDVTAIEAPNTANAYDKEMEKETKTDANDAKQQTNKRRHDNDGQVSGMPQSVAVSVSVPIATDKPLSAANTKQKKSNTKSKTKTKTKTKITNEIDTKPTSTSSLSTGSTTLMIGTANVKAPVKKSPEITHTPLLNSPDSNKMVKEKEQQRQKHKQKQKPKEKVKSKRKGSIQEQEIETTTNWWHILPYAEIRKFLNTIYDSIAEDDDERRAQRI